MRYLARIYRYAGEYSALVPDLPGCVAVAKSGEQVRKLLAEAVAMHLELMRQSGEKIPRPRRQIDFPKDETDGEEFCTWVEVKKPGRAASAEKRH